MNNPKLKLAIARMLPEQLHEIYPCDDRTMEQVQKANEVSWCWNEPRRRVLETEWLYIVSLVEQQELKSDGELIEKYWLALYDATETTSWPFDATFNQRATALCKVKGVEI